MLPTVSYKTILTHPGSAHKDDFLACCLLVSKYKLPITRREPHVEELANPGILIVDTGQSHDPEAGNFDHHQFPRDHAPICALSLVCKNLGVFDSATKYLDWFETLEWFDSRGPEETARWLGVSRSTLNKLTSPIEITVLNLFSQASSVEKNSMLWQLMEKIGSEFLSYLKALEKRLHLLKTRSEIWNLVAKENHKIEVLFLHQAENFNNPSLGIEQYVKNIGLTDSLKALVYPDQRGSGYTLTRYHDNQSLDFSQLQEQTDVHFTHKRGFVAKTSSVDITRLKDLIRLASVSSSKTTM